MNQVRIPKCGRWRHLAIWLSFCVAPATAQTGKLSGLVQDSTGKAVAGATVVVNIRSTPGAFTPFSAITVTGSNGTYAVGKMPAGSFDVCPQLPSSDLVPICSWETPPTVTLKDGESAAVPKIVLKAGARIKVRVNDASGAVAAETAKGTGAFLSIEVASPRGIPIPTAEASKDATGHTREIVIPFDQQVQILALAKGLTMTDNKGAPVEPSKVASIPVLVPSGSKAPDVTLTITGANP